MSLFFTKLSGRIDRRGVRDDGDYSRPYMRENWLSRDGVLIMPQGTVRATTTTLSGKVMWMGRYHTIETGIASPKSFAYTDDGKMWVFDDVTFLMTEVSSSLNPSAYPKHTLYKVGNQTKMYLVDGKDLYKHDGNNSNIFEKIIITDTGGDSINPIDVIEHKDRLCLISDVYLYISKNLDPEVFSDSTDSIQIIVGSGKGKNYALGKIPGNDTLFIFNTEGIFALYGDTISAVASTFELRLVDGKRIIAGRTARFVENAIVFLADDYNLYSFNGNTSTKISHDEKLEDFIHKDPNVLKKAVATYYNNYYMMSFVETGQVNNRIEVWWDAIEDKCEFVRGRNVSCYLDIDPTIEPPYQMLGRSDINMVMWSDREYMFDGLPVQARLWTKDITPKKNTNVRFTAFYPQLRPHGHRYLQVRYWLDGRISDSGDLAKWTTITEGENKTLGFIEIPNQNQFSDVVRPRINYAKGQSVAFYIAYGENNGRCDLLGIGMDFISKERKGVKTIGG